LRLREFQKKTMSAPVDEKSTDPFVVLVPDVFDKILQYLSGRDILNTLAVSPLWNREVGNLKVAMKKIQLVFNPRAGSSRKKDSKVILSSQRHYRNVKLESVNFVTKKKNLRFDYLKNIAPFIAQLTLEQVKFGDKELRLPSLRKLILLDGSPVNAILNADTASKLKTFIVTDSALNSSKINNFLMMCNELKKLKLLGSFQSSRSFFKDESRLNYPFKLDALEITWNYVTDHDSILGRFLKLQDPAKLRLHSSQSNIIRMALELPGLRNLILCCYEMRQRSDGLPVNTSIEALSVRGGSSLRDVIGLVDFLTAMPNLKKLTFMHFRIHQATLKLIATSCLQLRKLYHPDADSTIAAYYKRLKTQNPAINQNIRIIHRPYR